MLPSGVVEGRAGERAAVPLRSLPDTDFCLSLGGALVCRTLDADTPPWRTGTEDPADPRRLVAVLPVPAGAVATSGTTHRGRHLVDARTGAPHQGVMSITVVSAALTDADVDATVAYGRGEDAAQWLGTCPGRAGPVGWADGATSVIGGDWGGVSGRRHVVMTYGRQRPGPRPQGDSRCASGS